MSRLILIRDEKFREHLTPEMHPESPQRLVAIDQALKHYHLDQRLTQVVPVPASEDDLVRVHNADYVENIFAIGKQAKETSSIVPIDPDTWMSPQSYEAGTLAAGAGISAIDAIAGAIQHAFVAVRPPGHHAFAGKAMGFCLFNNIAIAARYAQSKLGLERILIIDWDVHHGNGTQDLFYRDPGVCFISLHQYPFWPGTGWFTEDGADEGKGYNINIPLPRGTGDAGYLRAWDEIVQPIALQYKPQLILVSAGYDAHQADPLAEQQVSTEGYALLSQRLSSLAAQLNTKVVCFLEGGYDTKALSDSVLATVNVLNLDKPEGAYAGKVLLGIANGERELAIATLDDEPVFMDERLVDIKAHFSRFWSSLR